MWLVVEFEDERVIDDDCRVGHHRARDRFVVVGLVVRGLVIAGIDNGMGLQGYSAYVRSIITALVLLAAVIIDSLTPRGRTLR